MSMRDYAVNDYGLLMTDDMLKVVSSKKFEDFTEEGFEEDSYYFADMLYDAGIIDYIGSFTGEAIHIDDNGFDNWNESSDTYSDGCVYYIPTKRISTLFKSAYNNIEEMVEEFKERIGEYFTEDFDYRNKIRHISGVYYG